MDGVGRVACQGFLVREVVLLFWWVGLDFFSLECNEVSSNKGGQIDSNTMIVQDFNTTPTSMER